jgi:hypothetical protein
MPPTTVLATIDLTTGALTPRAGEPVALESAEGQAWLAACPPGTRLRVRGERVHFSLAYEPRRGRSAAYWTAIAYVNYRSLRRHVGTHASVRLKKLRTLAATLGGEVEAATADAARGKRLDLRRRDLDALLAGVPRAEVVGVLSQIRAHNAAERAACEAAERVLRAVLELPDEY